MTEVLQKLEIDLNYSEPEHEVIAAQKGVIYDFSKGTQQILDDQAESIRVDNVEDSNVDDAEFYQKKNDVTLPHDATLY